MELDLKPKREVWRKRGRQPMELPEEVYELLKRTYRTGEVGIITFDPDDPDDIAEMEDLLSKLRSGANRQEKRLRVQNTEYDQGIVRYEMCDKAKPRGRSAAPVEKAVPIKKKAKATK